jgi:hypothetical protein
MAPLQENPTSRGAERIRTAVCERSTDVGGNTPRRSLYFIQEGDRGPIKIGIAHEVDVRLSGLQTGNPRPLRLLLSCPVPEGTEARLHERLARHCIRGEWFRPVEAVHRALEACHEAYIIGPLLDVGLDFEAIG